MSESGGSIKNPENEAENPAPMPNASIPTTSPQTGIKGPEKPTDIAGQQGGTHGGGKG